MADTAGLQTYLLLLMVVVVTVMVEVDRVQGQGNEAQSPIYRSNAWSTCRMVLEAFEFPSISVHTTLTFGNDPKYR